MQNLSVLNLETIAKQFKETNQQAIIPSEFEIKHLNKLIEFIGKIDIN